MKACCPVVVREGQRVCPVGRPSLEGEDRLPLYAAAAARKRSLKLGLRLVSPQNSQHAGSRPGKNNYWHVKSAISLTPASSYVVFTIALL